MTSVSTRLASSFAPENRRRTAFFVVVLLALAPYALVAGFLPAAVLGWVGMADFAHHQIHDMAFAGLLWIGLIGLLAQFHRPESKASVMLAVVITWLLVAVVSVAASGLDAFIALFAAPPVVAALLHPAGRDLLRVDAERIDPLLVGLAVVAAVPLIAFAADQFTNQVTLADDHAALDHWGGMAAISLGILALAVLTALRHAGFRLTGWLTGAFAAYFGALSLAFPAVTASNVGTTWAVAAVVWGVAVVVATERAARDGVVSVDRAPPAERPA